MARYIYELEPVAFGSDSDEGRWYCKELGTYGDTLEDLLDNATYFKIDQDGGEFGEVAADDNEAVKFITNWYNEQVKK